MTARPIVPPLAVLVVGFILSLPAGAAIEYTILDLRVLSGDTVGDMHPYHGDAINDLGQVTGYGYLVPDRLPSDDYTAHPYVYDPATGNFVNLGDIDGDLGESGNGGNGYDINNDGWVTGRNKTGFEPAGYRAYYWKDVNGNGVSDAGEMNNLGTDPEYEYSYGLGMNNVGQVVGYDINYDTDIETGWVWTDLNGNGASDPGEKTLLPGVSPSEINDAGQVVGAFPEGGGRWTDANADGVMDEGEVAIVPNEMNQTKASTAEAVNASGQVTGILTNGYGKKQGYLWTDTDEDNVVDSEEIAMFGTDFQNTFVCGMNDSGEIVGGSYYWRGEPGKGTSRRAYIRNVAGELRDLNELIPEYSIEGYGPFLLTQAEGINNQGQIVVTGWFDNNGDGSRGSTEPEHVIVLTPRLAGDLNLDGVVSSADLDVVRANWGTQVTPGSLEEGDGSGDGEVNSQDLDLVRSTWGQGFTAAAVPEPSAVLLLGVLATGMVLGRVRGSR